MKLVGLVDGRLPLFAVRQIEYDVGEQHIGLGLLAFAAWQPFIGCQMPPLNPLLQGFVVVEAWGLLPWMAIQLCRYPDGGHLPILLKTLRLGVQTW